jgi:hypothetical protein
MSAASILSMLDRNWVSIWSDMMSLCDGMPPIASRAQPF